MKYKSTHNHSSIVNFREAVIQGLAEDKGLFLPVNIPSLPDNFILKLPKMSITEIAYEFLKPYVADELSDNELKDILTKALNFEIPLVGITSNISVLELFYGPTMAFKDVGARIMARLLAKFIKDKEVTILVATSGDTGSAVANGFLNVPGVKVIVLYPKNMVSKIQEKQFSTLGNNISVIEVNGNFDDCQQMVKDAFVDTELNKQLQLSSANSINIARLLPQAIYYFYAYAQLKDKTKNIVFSVPSGNFGNLTAGIIAKFSGLPIKHFIAATNINDIVSQYIKTGIFKPRASISTISNAMDVGNPSNFNRILALYQHSYVKIKSDIKAYSFTDVETRNCIKSVYNNYHYILDPHGAVAYLSLSEYLKKYDASGIFLETAHPAKFHQTVEQEIPVKVQIPERLQQSIEKESLSIKMENSFSELKEFLLKGNY